VGLLRLSRGVCVVGFVVVAIPKGGDAKGFCIDGGDGGVIEDGNAEGFGIDRGEGKCPFIGTLEGVCVIVLCGDRGDTFVLLDGAEGEGGKSTVGGYRRFSGRCRRFDGERLCRRY